MGSRKLNIFLWKRQGFLKKTLLYSAAKKSQKKKQLKHEDTFDAEDDDENTKDWWTKYFWSYEKLIDDSKELNKLRKSNSQNQHTGNGTGCYTGGKDERSKLGIKGAKLVARLSPKHVNKVEKTKVSTALCHVSTKCCVEIPISVRSLFHKFLYASFAIPRVSCRFIQTIWNP